MKLSEQFSLEISKRVETSQIAKFYQDYLELSEKYAELVEQGLIRPRESRLRLITDPLIAPVSASNKIRQKFSP